MSEAGNVVTRTVHRLENRFDRLKSWLGQRTGSSQQLQIQPYLGFGDRQQLFLHGRVLAGYHYRPAGERDRAWRNLWQTYRRMESDEVPHARLRARIGPHDRQVVANDEGFFEFWMDNVSERPIRSGWQKVELRLLSPAPQQGVVRATARAQIPAESARFGVISDLDDTVVRSYVAQRLRMARTIFLSNARTRQPFPGVAEFYLALNEGAGVGPNPLFYVSSSPWNFYDLFMEFFQLHGIPPAPLFLRDWGIRDNELLPTKHTGHKLAILQRLLTFYHRLPFILIGDNGQEDPEIYLQLARTFPQGIPAAYIRDVARSEQRTEAVAALEPEFAAAGCQLVVARDTAAMAEHAYANGLISAPACDRIRAQCAG